MKYYAIHCEGNTVRKQQLQKLSDVLGSPITLQLTKLDPLPYLRVADCTRNHVEALTKFLQTEEEEAVIFEDDAEIVDFDGFRQFYLDAPKCDILYFGVKEYVNSIPQGNYTKTCRSWGVHAYLVNRWAATCIVNEYNCIKQNNPPGKLQTLPPDWLINYAIQDFELEALGPTVIDALCVQKGESLISPMPDELQQKLMNKIF
jgi:hypothetical protein